MPNPTSLSQAALLFHGELRALHEFNTELGARADALDQEKRTEFIASVSAEIARYSPQPEQRGAAAARPPAEPTPLSPPDPAELQKRLETLNAAIKEITAKPDHPAYNVARTFFAALVRIPARFQSHGAYLRRGLLSNFTTTFEVLVSRLVRDYYVRYPDALTGEERSLTLAELRGCGSVESAESLLLERELDALMFRPIHEILDRVIARFSLPKPLLETQRLVLEELFLRRNLFVHNLGVINHHYLAKLPAAYPERPAEGTTLTLDTQYLAGGIDCVLTTGILLLHAAWTKWAPADTDGSTALLLHLIYECLSDRQFKVVAEFATYFYFLKGIPEDRQRAVRINHAIALGASGDNTGAAQLLAQADWSACAVKFQMAVAILRGNHDVAIDLLQKAVSISEVTGWDLAHWPLFDSIRKDPAFQDLLKARQRGIGAA